MFICTQNGIFITQAQNNGLGFFFLLERPPKDHLNEHDNRVLLPTCHSKAFKKKRKTCSFLNN